MRPALPHHRNAVQATVFTVKVMGHNLCYLKRRGGGYCNFDSTLLIAWGVVVLKVFCFAP